MKHKFTLLLLLFFSITAFSQQDPWDLGVFLGAATLSGDLVGTDGPSLKATNFAYGVFARRYLNRYLALRANLSHGKLQSDDHDYAALRQRGFSASSPFTELSISIDWDMLGRNQRGITYSFASRFSPYAFVGLGLVFTNPTTDFNTKEKGLRPEITADQTADFAKTAVTFPFGAGIKFMLSNQWSIGLEGGLRMTSTDYLDGVSQAGGPDSNDWYGLSGFHLIYRPTNSSGHNSHNF